MTPYLCVLLSALALCDAASSSTTQQVSPQLSSDCEYPADDYGMVWEKGMECALTGSTPETTPLFTKALRVEDYRVFFADYCQRTAVVRNCLAHQLTRFETCQNEKRLKIFTIYRHGMEHLLNVGCVEDSAKMATFFDGLVRLLRNGTTGLEGAMTCVRHTEVVFTSVESTGKVDLASVVYILWKELPTLRACLSKVSLERPFGEVTDWVIGEIIRTAKCVDPLSGDLAACDSVNMSRLRSSSLCAAKTEGGSAYDSLETDAVGCVGNTVDKSVRAPSTGDLEKLRDDFALFCRMDYYLSQCSAKVATVAEMCLDEMQRKEFSVLADALKTAVVSACAGKGDRIADIMYEVYHLKNNTGRDAVRDCIDVAMATRKKQQRSYSAVAKNLRFYHEAVTFKTCLLENLARDPRSVVAATAMLEEMIGGLLCLHPENHTTVRCETLVITA